MVRAAYRPMLALDRILATNICRVARLHQDSEKCKLLRVGGELLHKSRPGRSEAGNVRSLGLSSPHQYQAKLTPAEVTSVLRANEYTSTSLPHGPVKSFDMNTLQSK